MSWMLLRKRGVQYMGLQRNRYKKATTKMPYTLVKKSCRLSLRDFLGELYFFLGEWLYAFL